MLDKRRECSAVKLDDDRIFIYGGAAFDSKGQWHCELYDPRPILPPIPLKCIIWDFNLVKL
jgi:hypothetical protein